MRSQFLEHVKYFQVKITFKAKVICDLQRSDQKNTYFNAVLLSYLLSYSCHNAWFPYKNHIEKMGHTHCEVVAWRDLCQTQVTTAVDKSLKALVISSIKRMRMIDSCTGVCVCVCPLPWRRSCICPRERPPRLSATGAAGWTLARKRLSFAGNSAVAYSSLNLLLQTDRRRRFRQTSDYLLHWRLKIPKLLEQVKQ